MAIKPASSVPHRRAALTGYPCSKRSGPLAFNFTARALAFDFGNSFACSRNVPRRRLRGMSARAPKT